MSTPLSLGVPIHVINNTPFKFWSYVSRSSFDLLKRVGFIGKDITISTLFVLTYQRLRFHNTKIIDLRF